MEPGGLLFGRPVYYISSEFIAKQFLCNTSGHADTPEEKYVELFHTFN